MPDETTATPSAPAPTGGKKSNATTIIIIVVIALVVLGAGGYFVSRWLAKRASEKAASALLSATTGSNVSVSDNGNSATVSDDQGTTQIGEGAKWPSDMPSDVPKLTAGKITMATSDKSSKSWSVTASDIKQADYDAYKAKVVAAGWTSTATTSFGALIDQYEKGSYDLTLTFDSSSSGISISVVPKS